MCLIATHGGKVGGWLVVIVVYTWICFPQYCVLDKIIRKEAG